jgi:hypothetical protein
MTTVAVRGVTLNVVAPTLDDIIRDTSGPGSSGNREVTLTIPATAQIGDTLIVFTSARAYAEMTAGTNTIPSGWNRLEWYSYVEDDFWDTDPVSFPPVAIALVALSKIVETGDAGSGVTFRWKPIDWPQYEDEETYNISRFKPLAYMVVLKNTYYDYDDAMSGITSFGDDGGDISISNLSGVYGVGFWVKTVYETGGAIPPIGATELLDHSENGNHLFVAAKIISGGTMNYSLTTSDEMIYIVNLYLDV